MQTVVGDDGRITATLAGSSAFEELLAEADAADARHPIDRYLIESGVRWSTLRWIAVPARCDLVRWTLERTRPAGTQRAVSPAVWIDAVTDRIAEQTGTVFKQNRKRRRWWRIANVLRRVCVENGRPLTWISQEEIAAATACSTRTVRRCVAWLQAEGLLHEVVPGCQLPRAAVPDDETAEEQATREAAMAAAVAAEEAAMRRARAELADAAAGLLPSTCSTLDAESDGQDLDQDVDEGGPALVSLVPVYELSTPLSDAQRAEEAAVSRAHTAAATPGQELAAAHADELVAPVNAGVYRQLYVIGHDGVLTLADGPAAAEAVTCGNAAGLLRSIENVHPLQVVDRDLESNRVQVVEKPEQKRPAAPGSETKSGQAADSGAEIVSPGLTAVPEGERTRAPQSEAVRAARWLLRSRLHPDLVEGVSLRWLAGVIRGSRLLRAWAAPSYGQQASTGATVAEVPAAWVEIADLIHGVPEFAHLPRHIRNARGWIRARFARADAAVPPSKATLTDAIESASPACRARRRDAERAARRAELDTRRAAIDSCPRCDENGHAPDPADPTGTRVLKCRHTAAGSEALAASLRAAHAHRDRRTPAAPAAAEPGTPGRGAAILAAIRAEKAHRTT